MKSVVSAKQCRRHWNILKRFTPGYNPAVNVFGEFTPKGRPAGKVTRSGIEAYWLYQERGELHPTDQPEVFRDIYERASCKTLTIEMWKDTIRSFFCTDSIDNTCQCRHLWTGVLAAQSFVLELAADFPVSWLDSVGLLKMVGLTIRQVGWRMARRRSVEFMPIPE